MKEKLRARKIKAKKIGNTKPRTEKQLEAVRRAATLKCLTDNPMWDPEIAKRNADARRGKPHPNCPTLFKKGNKYGSIMTPKKLAANRRYGKLIGLKSIERFKEMNKPGPNHFNRGRTPYNKLSKEKENKIIELYLKGIKVHLIAKEVGCYVTTIPRVLKRNNIPLRKNQKEVRI
jgi:hypothetical protein